MSVVRINVLTVPEAAREALEERFAGRAGMVESAEGFEHFELLRPTEGSDSYLVYTRWRSEEDFVRWTESQAFGAGHRQAEAQRSEGGPAAMGSEIWGFEVIQSADKATSD
jgi:heme oxygenase (mycobilin-producing)